MTRRGMMAVAAMLAWAGAGAGPARAADGWFEARTDHFRVFAQGTAQSVAEFAGKLERYDRTLRYVRSAPEQEGSRANPLVVYVVPSVDTVQRLCSRGRARKCTDVYGFYVPRVGRSVAYTPRYAGSGMFDLNAQAVLFHEYAHHYMFGNTAAAYPAWFQEGFAEFNATTEIHKDGSVSVGKPPMYRAYGLIARTPLPVRTLLTTDGSKLAPEAQESLYGRGWLLTHYLTFAEKRDGQMTRYLQAINDGKTSLAAAEAAFGDLRKLDMELTHYVNERLMALNIPADRIVVTAPVVRPLGAGEAALLPVRWRSDRGVFKPEAEDIAIAARKAAAPFPADDAAQGALAEAEYDAGHDDAADAAADRALAADPKDRHALEYKGRAHLRRAVAAQAGDTPAWREARGWFLKANRLEPDDAVPLVLFYESFLAAGMTPTPNAVLGLQRALTLSPQDKGVRLMVAREYLRGKDYKAARRTLASLAFDPHAPADNPAAKLIAMIDAGDSAGVAAMLAGPAKVNDDDD